MSNIIRYISEISRCGAQFRSDSLSEMGLKACHSSYLTQICENPGISQDKLSRLICINKSNVARQVAALEEDGFLIRKTCPADKRVTELYPTEKTLALLPQLYEVLQGWEDYLTVDMTPEERTVLECVLKKMHPRAAQYMEER